MSLTERMRAIIEEEIDKLKQLMKKTEWDCQGLHVGNPFSLFSSKF